MLGKIKMGNRGAAPVIGRRLAKFLRAGLLASTALISVHAAALADGGTGGTPLHGDAGGGTGGSGPYGANGNSGSSSSTFRGYVASGGGGGGAGSGVNNGGTGGTGGGGQDNDPGLGGAGGTAASPDGQAGGNAGTSYTSNAGGGGGGGGYSAFSGAALSNSGGTTLTGGNGGDGGNASTPTGGANYFSAGGGGGEGGYGAVVTGAAASSNLGTVTGGTGGAGGAGLTAGNGGDGGIGIDFMASGATFTNGGAATGGAGGAAGGFYGGNSGAGGVGVVGSGLTVINSGSISGGLGGDGVTRADAIDFTGGSNSLTLSSGGTIGTLTGGIGITGSLSIDPGTSAGSAVTLSNVIHDLSAPGSLTKIGAGTLILSGANTYSGGTTISAGTLQVQNDSALGTGTLTLNGGTLQAGGSLSIANTIYVSANGGTIDGNGYQLGTDSIHGVTGTNGTLTILGDVYASSSDYYGKTIVGDGIAQATLEGGLTNSLSANSAYTVNANSFLEMGAGSQTIGSLSGAGTVLSNSLPVETLTTGGDNSSTVFSGLLSDGPGGLALRKTGTGTMTLSGANTYTGGTTISAGTLQVQNDSALGTGSVTLDGGTLQAGAGLTLANAIAINTAGGVIDANDKNLVLSGAITNGTGTTGTLTLTNSSSSGTVDLSSSGNTYSGATVIGDGTHAMAVTNSGGGSFSPNSAVTVNANAILGLASSQTIASLAGSGLVVGAGTLTTGGNNSSTVFSGVLENSGGVLGLTKTGTGTMTLSGANTYTGSTTIDTGATLKLSGNGSIASSSSVSDGGTLDISGVSIPGGASIVSLGGSGNVTLGSNTLTLTGATDAFSGSINGSGGLTVSGGTETLSGNNNYTGATYIGSDGSLILPGSITSNGSIASSSNVILDGLLGLENIDGYGSSNLNITTLNGNGSFVFVNGGSETLTLTLTAANGTFSGNIVQNLPGINPSDLVIANGTETLTGDNTYAGGTTIDGGAGIVVGNDSALGTGTVSMAANSTMGVTGNHTLANNFTISGDPTYDVETGDSLTLNGVIADGGSPGDVEKTGGGTLILSGTNTYSGGTTISSGTLQVQNDSALGTGSVTLDGGTLQAGADTMTVSNAFKINPSGGTIDMDGNGVLVLNGAITDGNGANGTLTIINSSGTTLGTVILSSTGNTYSGATVIGNGASGPNDVILADESGGNFSPNSAVTVTANSYLGLNGDETIGSLSGAGTVITEGLTIGKTLTTGGDNSSTTFSGVLQDFQGALSLTKTGTGTMTLSGANTYSGATVIDAGTLALEGSGRILNSSSVEDDGTFDISQTSGATIQNLTGNGRIALGSQTLNVQNTANSAFSGSIADGGIAGGTGGGIFVSTGRETLTGDNTYTGTTLIGNELFLSGNGSIASSSLVRVLGIFDISGTTAGASVKNLIGTGDINLGSQTLTITAGAGDFDGIIEDGGAGGGVTIAGGSMSLDRSNTYTGATTIDSGATLLIAGVGSIASSSGVQDDGIFDISGGPGVTSIQNLTGNGGVALGGHLLTIEATNGTFSGNISGSGGSLTIDGGTETLTGDNSFTGVMTVTGGGTLKLSGSGSIASSVEVYDGVPGGGGGTFDISGTTAGASIKTLAGIGSVKLGNQTLTITAANTTYEGTIGDGGLGGGLTISGGTATFAATSTYTGATKIDAGATLDLRYSASIASSSGVEDDGTLAISGNGDNSIKSLTGNGTLQLFNMALNITAANGTFSGSITNNAGGNGGLTLSGGSETLTGDSPSYIGNTTVGSNATLIVGNDNAVGTGSVSMAANSTMGVTGNITLANNFTIAGDPTYDVETGNSLTLNGVIADGGSPGTLEKTGGGTLTLNAANTYTGATIIDAGTLALGTSGAISASSGVEDDGAFDISGISAGASIKSLTGTGAADLGTQDLTLTSASGTFGGAIAGSGTFSIQGGTETLSGSSENFTGALEVFSGATLDLTGNASIANASQLYDGGTVDISGSDGISVAGINGGGEIILGDQTLTITGDNTVVYAGDITGDGGVTITGSEAFTNAQHYTGQTTVGSGGSLSLLTSGDISASSGVEDNGTFDISNINTDSTTIAALSGSGAVHLGDNTLIIAHGLGVFSGSFTAGTGGVTLAGGTTTITGDTGVPFAVDAGAALQLGDGGTSGAVADNVVNNGTVIFDRSDTVTYSTLITGNGDLTQAGTGTLIVDSAIAPGNVTVSNGTLQVGTGGNTGSLGSANVTDNGVLAFDRSDTVTITRAISGSGDLDMIGSGTLIYDTQGSATGLTTVSSGTLEVGDSNTPAAFLSGGVDVLSGGTLMGHGAVNGDVTVGSGGTLRPGGTIGTLTVNGNVSLAAGSTFVEEVSPAAGDRLNVSGAATLKGALDVVQDSGTYAAGTDYTIVSANSVTGTFSSVSGDVFPGLTADVVYSATAVDLVLSTSGKPIVRYNFPTYGKTPNQKAAGAALNKASPGGDLYKTAGGLVTLDSSGAPGVLEELAGDIHASVATAAINESRMVRDTLLGELDDRQEPRRYLWIDGYGDYGNTGSDGNASGMHTTTGGLIGGIDIPLLDAMRVGIAGAYSSDTVTTERHQSSADGHLAHIIGYAAYDTGNFAINAAVDYGSGSSATSRSLEDFGERDAAHRDQSLTQEFGRVSYRVNNDVFPVVPYLGLVHVESRTGAFAESGGITALSGSSANDDVTYSLLGVRAAMDSLVVGNSMMLTPRADFAWDHAFNHFIPAQLLTYENTGTSFAVQGAPLAQDSAAVQIGADLAINSSITISLTYDGLFSNSAQNNAVRGGLAWKF